MELDAMASRALLIEVRLLDGRYHGAGDWPPAPFRLFQALVAGAYGGRWRAEPDEAYYSPEMKEFILPYEVVRRAKEPDLTLMRFLQSTYEAAADLGGWDRAALERAQ